MIETIFDEQYKKLNPAQKEAVDTTEGPVMVIAGPGTGKTQILTLRIANILKTTDIGPENILALTFTRKAAQEMKLRVLKTLNIAETTFVDSTTKAGNSYSYALVAQFEDGVGLVSYSKPALTPSDTCIQLPIYIPLPI